MGLYFFIPVDDLDFSQRSRQSQKLQRKVARSHFESDLTEHLFLLAVVFSPVPVSACNGSIHSALLASNFLFL